MVAEWPESIAPEQALGQQARVAADIFALTLIAYEMLCSAPAYEANSAVRLLHARAYEDPRSPREINPEIPSKGEAALLKGLARVPGQ